MHHGLPPAQYGDAGIPKFPHGVVIHALQWLHSSRECCAGPFSRTTQRRLTLLASRASGLLLIYASLVTLLGRARFDAPPELAMVLYVALATLFCLSSFVGLGIMNHRLAQNRN